MRQIQLRGWRRWNVATIIAVAFLAPHRLQAVSLSGTVQYSGSLAAVSSAQPIRVDLFLSASLTHHAGKATVFDNGGPFGIDVATAGTYYLEYFLDLHGNSDGSVGDPFAIYNQRFTLPGDPIAVPLADVNLAFDDTAVLSGIAGTVTYTGKQGPVAKNKSLRVRAFPDAQLTGHSRESPGVVINGGRYDIITFDNKTYYLQAYLDVNDNAVFDAGEPFQIYSGQLIPPGDPVIAGPDQTSINFSFGDDTPPPTPSPTATPTPSPTPRSATATPTRTHTPSPTPTLGPCVGDCNHNGSVTVEELVEGVDMALGIDRLDRCPEFDIDGDGQVTVDELIQAVNATLAGCVSRT